MDDPLRLVEALLEGVLQTIRLARAMMLSGRAVELAGLSDKVGLLCAKVMDLPPEQGRMLRPHLLLLMRELDETTASARSPPPPWRPAATADPEPT